MKIQWQITFKDNQLGADRILKITKKYNAQNQNLKAVRSAKFFQLTKITLVVNGEIWNSTHSLFHQELKISWQNSRKIHKIHEIFNEAFLVGTECKFDTQFQREINIEKIFEYVEGNVVSVVGGGYEFHWAENRKKDEDEETHDSQVRVDLEE